jgi:hypothetical protein
VSPTATQAVNKTISSSPKSVNKFNQANISPLQQVTHKPIIAKIPKLNLQNTEETQADSINKQQKQINKTLKNDNRHVLSRTDAPVPSNKLMKTSSSQEKLQTTQPSEPLSETTSIKTKPIPSLFDIQPTPVLNKQKTDNTTTTTNNATTAQASSTSNSNLNKTISHTNARKQVTQVKSKPNHQILSNTKQIKPVNSTSIISNKKQSDLKQNEFQPQKKQNIKTTKQDDLIFGNYEDIDERFSNTNSNSSTNSIIAKTYNINKSDDIRQKIINLSEFISSNKSLAASNDTPSSSASNTKTLPSNELLASLFDSNNKIQPNVLALIAS